MLIGVVCSDPRMQQVCDNLRKDFSVYPIHKDTNFMLIPQLDCLVFSVKGVDVDGNVKIEDEVVHIPSVFWKSQGKNLIVYTGIKTSVMQKLHAHVIYYMEDEGVVEANAILTAEGVLFELIRCTCKSMYTLCVDVVGYGCCGKAIYNMLKNLHVTVRVVRREPCKEHDFISLGEWDDCSDIIINTSIGPSINKQHLAKWKTKPIVLDIATPDVLPLDEFATRGICCKKIGNLPGMYACITAGNIIADFIRGNICCER